MAPDDVCDGLDWAWQKAGAGVAQRPPSMRGMMGADIPTA